jgi:hypothetical protein
MLAALPWIGGARHSGDLIFANPEAFPHSIPACRRSPAVDGPGRRAGLVPFHSASRTLHSIVGRYYKCRSGHPALHLWWIMELEDKPLLKIKFRMAIVVILSLCLAGLFYLAAMEEAAGCPSRRPASHSLASLQPDLALLTLPRPADGGRVFKSLSVGPLAYCRATRVARSGVWFRILLMGQVVDSCRRSRCWYLVDPDRPVSAQCRREFLLRAAHARTDAGAHGARFHERIPHRRRLEYQPAGIRG